ncbi:beta-phosphoglucomutase family hydrolase [Nitrosococcus halophilus Nc 4]|uniref:Beta-phosphoglucomutase family hydrolase n=1 Tax=Nitrosococcus halophilus (strain Nc4) TaxID=472759 RepID=D5BZY6_NITHN|nr:trehalose-phosphatase [Nitrosococcus halophilus]ADE16233.1 beta-phosphoglucomutase family hydrolase [Nitrosococcus halophilus Nc 4]
MNTHKTISRSYFDAVIFDLDGVITRTARVHAAAWKSMFDDFLQKRAQGAAFKPFDDHDYREYVDGKPRYEGVRSFLQSRNIELPYGDPCDLLEKETVCGLGNRKNELFQEKLKKEGAEVYHTSVQLIRRLRSKGFQTAVVSSSKNCGRILDTVKLTHLFEVKVDGNDAATLDLKGKPHPDIFLEAANRLGLEPKRCVVFEDAIAGVKAGRQGQFGRVIGVDREKQTEALKAAGADIVVKDLAEIGIVVHMLDLSLALEALSALQDNIAQREVVTFLDYDGTLTPIVSHPEKAILSGEMGQTLRMLAEQCTVAIISGRGLQDVRQRVAIDSLYYAGSHGFEIAGPGELEMEQEQAQAHLPALDEAEKALKKQLENIAGAQIERKRFSIAVHYRNVAEAQIGAIEKMVEQTLEQHPGLHKSHGKKVYELQPDVAWDKGRALLWLLDKLELNRPDVLPLYIGDDITDEDAFQVLEERGLGLVVGEEARDTYAEYRLKDSHQVREFLHALTRMLGERNAWTLTYRGFEAQEEGLREALCTLGNGYFATRGAAPESQADNIHYPGTYLAGGYNRLKTAIAGRTVENEDLVNLPNWLCLDFRHIDGKWFDLKEMEILFYRQELDIKRGILTRIVHFRDEKDRETRVTQRRLASMAHMHLAALETVIIPLNWSGTLEVHSALDGQVINSGVARYQALNSKHLKPVETQPINNQILLLKVRTNQSQLTIAQAARLEVFLDNKPAAVDRQMEEETAYVAQAFTVEMEKGIPLTLEKTVALYTARDSAISECGLEAVKTIQDAPRFEGLWDTHCLAWKHLWRQFDMQLEIARSAGNHHIQRILRLYSFHLLQSASMHSLDIDVGMPSRGWHGEAYRGHIFWDELIIFPFLNYRAPQITQTLLMYRYRRLNEARKAARALGYKGAMYPWQSGSDGREESQQLHLNPQSGRWIPDNSHLQRHINAAIAYNIWQYFQVTGDLNFLAFYGAEMILEIARFWASIATYNEGLDRYEILGIMGPDEFHDAYPEAESPGLNNNAYTNLMAVFVLNKALELFQLLPEQECQQLCEKLAIQESEKTRWQDISRKMRVVFHDDGIISQFEGYAKLEEFDWEGYRKKYDNIQRLDRLLEAEGDTVNRYKASKQADVLMLFYLFSSEELGELFKQLGYPFDPEQIPKNIDYYLQRTSNGSSLSWIIHSWVATRRDREHSWQLFQEALKTDVADIQGGTTPEGIHLGAMAGCVDLVQRCYTGLEARGQVLRLNPRFPEKLRSIHIHLRYRGHWLELEISCEKLKIESLTSGAAPVKIEVKGSQFQLEEGKVKEIQL